MKRAAVKKPTGAGRNASSIQRAPEPVDFANLRERIRETVSQEAVGMVEATITAVKDGQYAALKYLFEMAGLFPAEVASEPTAGDGLASTLLQRLGLPKIPETAQEVTKDSPQGPKLP